VAGIHRSRIRTVLVAVITSNLDLSVASGNVILPAETSGGFTAG
jgi:hypothetical protein